jgi:hypothetical protein
VRVAECFVRQMARPNDPRLPDTPLPIGQNSPNQNWRSKMTVKTPPRPVYLSSFRIWESHQSPASLKLLVTPMSRESKLVSPSAAHLRYETSSLEFALNRLSPLPLLISNFASRLAVSSRSVKLDNPECKSYTG